MLKRKYPLTSGGVETKISLHPKQPFLIVGTLNKPYPWHMEALEF